MYHFRAVTHYLFLFSTVVGVSSSTTGTIAPTVDDPFSDILKCAQQTSSPGQCTATSISDGRENCVYCTSETVKQPVCTTPQASQAMKGIIPDLDCGDGSDKSAAIAQAIEAARLRTPYSDHVACGDQLNSKQCTSTKISDGVNCVYCTSDIAKHSACFTPRAVQKMKAMPTVASDLVCDELTGDEEVPAEDESSTAKDSIQDLLLCAQNGASPDQCTGTEMSDGEHCVMCSSKAVNQNICTTPSASSMLKQFIKDLQCGDDGAKVEYIRGTERHGDVASRVDVF